MSPRFAIDAWRRRQRADFESVTLRCQKRAKSFETPDHDSVGIAASRSEHLEIVGKYDKVLASVAGCGLQCAAHFSKTAGTDLSGSGFAEAVAKYSHWQDADTLKFLGLVKIQSVPEINSAIRVGGVEAAIDCYSALSKSAVGIRVAGEAPGPKGGYFIAAGASQKPTSVVKEGALFLQRIVG